MKTRRLVIRVAAVLVLIIVGIIMSIIGRGHTIYLENKTLEYNGQTYQAFFPAETEGEEVEEEDTGLVILKVIHEDGEDLLSTPDSEEEAEAVYQLFMEELFEDEDEE